MTYNSSSGSISGWVEKLQNIEGAIKATQENLKRRANGLPPLPPPGLSHMQPSKQSHQQYQTENSSSGAKPKGAATTVSKPIIGLGRGKRFTKQNSAPVGISETIVSPVSTVPVGGAVSSCVTGKNNGMLAQSQPDQPLLLSNGEIFGQDRSKYHQMRSSSEVSSQCQLKQQSSSSEILKENEFKRPQLLSSSEAFRQLSSSSVNNQERPKNQQQSSSSSELSCLSSLQSSSSSESFDQDKPTKQQLSSSSGKVFNHSQSKSSNSNQIFSHDPPKKQQVTSSSKQASSCSDTLKQNLLSNSNEKPPQEQSISVTPKQMPRNNIKTNDSLSTTHVTTSVTSTTAGRVIKSLTIGNLSITNSTTSVTPTVVTSTTVHQSFSTPVSTPVVSSRAMSYSSAVTSQPARRLPPPHIRPQQPFNRMPFMQQQPPPPHLVPAPLPPHMFEHNQPHVVGLGRGVGPPWSAGPAPHSWGGNGHYMHKMPPPPMHFNFDHHHGPFYEIPSSGLHGPFFPPMGSSSGLDII